MKHLLTIIGILFFINPIHSQVAEIVTKTDEEFLAGEQKAFEFFGKGLIDFGINGQVQASAQVLKIYIGEPNGFRVPIYLLTGTTSANLGKNEINKNVIFDLINPTGGLLNLSGNFYAKEIFKSQQGITRLTFNSYFGAKLLSGRDSLNNDPSLNIGFNLDPGISFQTGAWDGNESYKEGGIFWFQAKYLFTWASSQTLQGYFGENSKKAPHGPKIESGLFIKNKVNIKISYFRSIGKTNIPTLDKGQFRIGLEYSVK